MKWIVFPASWLPFTCIIDLGSLIFFANRLGIVRGLQVIQDNLEQIFANDAVAIWESDREYEEWVGGSSRSLNYCGDNECSWGLTYRHMSVLWWPCSYEELFASVSLVRWRRMSATSTWSESTCGRFHKMSSAYALLHTSQVINNFYQETLSFCLSCLPYCSYDSVRTFGD